MNGGRMIMSSATTKTHNATTSPTRPTAHEEAPTSEEIVIGTVLADPKLASRVYARLGPEDLGEPRVAWIYEAAMELARKGEAVEPATVAEQLRATRSEERRVGKEWTSRWAT